MILDRNDKLSIKLLNNEMENIFQFDRELKTS